MPRNETRIGIDIGGTFTDFAIWQGDAAGYVSIATHKVPSTPPEFAQAVINGLEDIIARHGIAPDDPVTIVHGTTVSTNAVIERRGPSMAFLTTRGFRDLLGLGRLRLDRPVDIFNQRPLPLVPRRHVFEIDERILADGSIDRALQADEVARAVKTAVAQGVEAIGICFLHAFRNPAHEQAALAAARAAAPDVEIIASHEVWPQEGEYERAIVTLLNAFVRRVMDGYIGEIETYLEKRLGNARLFITKSNGGVMAAGDARRFPVHTLLSGPAAGVSAARYLGSALDSGDVLTMDMGGTSTDMSLIRDGQAMTSTESRVGDFPLMMPVTAIEALGAGGGSLVRMDGPVLKVGPGSAGATPGPACYGLGGTEPTLSDAYLLSGYLNPDSLLGGRMPMRADLAEQAFGPIAATLGMSVADTAEACIKVATSNMLASVLPFLARLGVNPTDLSLMIFGGAGGIHGPLLAEEVGIRRIIVPRTPSVFCALGCLVSELRHDLVQSVHGATPDESGVRTIFAALKGEADRWLETQTHGHATESVAYMPQADMRYLGQSFQVTAPLPQNALDQPDMATIAEAFHAEHQRLFGHSDPTAPVEFTDLRLTLVATMARPEATATLAAGTAPPAPKRTRAVRFRTGPVAETPVFAREDLAAGDRLQGPAIIEQADATIVVPPGYDAEVGRFGDLMLTMER
ncbi:hydantoinase/oxoprolinase family protein [Oceanibacterium hippocampi]|uniref:Acetophenone carboxylase gamma subunit n=1 Tax=Oceanibacterium hippocampi TaxID=745714 RepID=A0A1Y5TIP6_9PROT|nr:hydantoinase/oxoprolinase family protein [Oceanibacterium hippocampi]SLN64869.1 Acetophenone carboxylase gamma subunit [Oceanibacterium hippocampi]